MGKINLHIGPHKTATTHLQIILENSAFRDNTQYVPLWKVRENVTDRYAANEDPRDTSFLNYDDGLLLISEENFSGFPLGGPRFYPRIKRYLGLFKDHETTVFFCPRNYAAFITSVYCEALRFSEYFDFPNITMQRGWIQVLEDVQEVLPNATIKLWHFEDYLSNWQAVVRYFSDDTVEKFGDPPSGDGRGQRRSTLSQKTVETYSALHQYVNNPNEVIEVLDNAMPTSVAFPRYSPFKASKIEELTNKYHADCEVLSQRYDVFSPAALQEQSA
ncbi:MAG: hypothetical protein AAFQ04_12460 [Pseudomonadota bacterium]